MFTRTRKTLRAWPILLATLALLLVDPRAALAQFKVGTGLFNDGLGTIYLNGGTDDAVWVGSGTANAPAAKVIPDCDDAAGNHLNYDQTTNTFTCGTSSSGAAVFSQVGWTTSLKINLNGNTVFFDPFTGGISDVENDVSVPVGAGSWKDLRCKASDTVGGTSLSVEITFGTCGSGATFDCQAGDLCVSPTGTTPTTVDTSTLASTAGQCAIGKFTATGDTNEVFVNCSFMKTANS